MKLYKKNTLIIFICFLFILTSCGVKKDASIPLKESINSHQEVQNKDAENQHKEPLKFVIASILSLKETQLTYYKLAKYLEKKLNYPIEIVQKQTYNEVKRMFDEGTVDIGLVCAYLSYLGESEGVLKNISIPVVDGSKKFTSYIITKKDSSISDLESLKGNTFAFTDPLSYSGYIAAKHQIQKNGFDFNSYFSKTYYTYSHDNSIFAVANGLVDGAAVHSMVYDNLIKQNDESVQKTKIIAKGILVGNPPIVVQSDMDPILEEKITSIFINMVKDEEGKEILRELNIDYFDKVEKELYAPIPDMLKDIE